MFAVNALRRGGATIEGKEKSQDMNIIITIDHPHKNCFTKFYAHAQAGGEYAPVNNI